MAHFEWTCSVCGEGNAQADALCSNCGSPSPHASPPASEAKPGCLCQSCGHRIEGSARFCPQCGTDVLKNPESRNAVHEASRTEAAYKPAPDPVEKPSSSDPIIVGIPPGRINKKFGAVAVLTFLLLEIISRGEATSELIAVVLIGAAIAFIVKAIGIRSTWAHLVLCVLFLLVYTMRAQWFVFVAAPYAVLFAAIIFTFRRADSGTELLKNSASRNSEPEIANPKGKQKPALHPEGNPPTSYGSPKSANSKLQSKKPFSRDAISSCTGVVTFAERETKKSTSNTPSSGDRGRVMEVRTLGISWRIIRFRVIVHNEAGGASRQVAAEVNIIETDIYLQEGDSVTLVGKVARNGRMYNPGIINHSGKFIMIPKEPKHLNVLGNPGIIIGLLGLVYSKSSFSGSSLDSMMAIFIVFGVPLGLIMPLLLRDFWMNRIGYHIAQLLKADGTWLRRTYKDPQGIIEGACLFSRGFKNPIEWVVFRMGMYDSDGKLLDRLVGAIPQCLLATELRKGDTVKWLGNFTTGKICRPQRVDVLSLKQR